MRFDIVNTTARLNGTEIEFVAKNYGARTEIDSGTTKEIVRFVIEKFGHFALDEIRTAYRMWASEEIKIEGAEMYGGSFNVRQIGKVLAAYNDLRKRVLGNYLKLAQSEIEEMEQRDRERAMKEKFEAEFPAIIMRAKDTITDWRQVPEYFYGSIMKRWGIGFEEGEAKAIFEDAKTLAKIEVKAENEKALNIGLKAISDARGKKNNVEEIAKVIARKITVFRKVINNPEFKISQ